MPDEPDTDLAAAATAPAELDTNARHRLMRALCNRRLYGTLQEVPEVAEPITADEAGHFATAMLGSADERDLRTHLNVCWLRLIAATTPEQRLSLERMITAIGIAIGMARHEEAARIIAENREAKAARWQAEVAALALDRWRGFGLKADQVAKDNCTSRST